MEQVRIFTVHSKIAQSRAGSTLNFSVMAAQEEEDGIQCIAADRTDFLLSNFRKGKSGTAL